MHTLLIALLLSSPFELPVPRQVSPACWRALKRSAQVLELVGPGESWSYDFRHELRYTRLYYRRLRHAPPLADAAALPVYHVAHACLEANRHYQRSLEGQRALALWRYEDYTAALADTARLHAVWYEIAIATNEKVSWAGRRQALAELRALLGDEAYYAHVLPPALPLWRFARLP